jgi:hypothetical protein
MNLKENQIKTDIEILLGQKVDLEKIKSATSKFEFLNSNMEDSIEKIILEVEMLRGRLL